MGQDPWKVHTIFSKTYEQYKNDPKKQSSKIQLPESPSLYLLDDPTPHVFCVIQSWHKVAFCFTTGLLDRLTPVEIEATCALLMTHSQRLKNFKFLVFAIFINCIIGFINFFQNFLPRPLNNSLIPRVLQNLFLKIMNPRGDIYNSDLIATEIFKDRFTLGKVLNKLNNYSFMAKLKKESNSHFIFITHPSMHPVISHRIQKLVGYYPL